MKKLWMKSEFDIAVITTILNASQYIERCIDSVAGQVGVRVQHIIVDGGSTDGTIELVKQRKKDVLILQGSSIYEALNFGMKHAKAPVLGFLNSDDVYASEESLKHVVDLFQGEKEKDVVYGNCLFVDQQGNHLYCHRPARKVKPRASRLRVFNISHPAWYISTDKMNELGGYDTSLRFVSDCDLIIRAVEQGLNFTYTNFDFARFTLHQTNASSSSAAKNEEKRYWERINGAFELMRVMRLLLVALMYCRDPSYYIYRVKRMINMLRHKM